MVCKTLAWFLPFSNYAIIDSNVPYAQILLWQQASHGREMRSSILYISGASHFFIIVVLLKLLIRDLPSKNPPTYHLFLQLN